MTYRLYSLLAASLLLILTFTLLLWLADADFFNSITAFFKGAFGGRNFAYLLVTISRAALITGMAIAALIAFRAGLFNIGGEGQLVVGGLASAFIAVNLPFGGATGIFLVLLSGMIAAGLWAVIAGVMKLWLGVPILVGTLLLNYPARYIASYFVSHPLRDISSGMPQTHLIEKSLWLPLIPGTRLDIGFIFILFVFCLMLIYCYRTVAGYEAKMTGLSIDFANASGLKTKKISLKTLALSGSIAGLVGAIAVLGLHHRFTDGMLVQPLYAWTGIVAALMVSLIPWAVLPAGFFFAAIHSGAAGMERTADVPKEIAVIIQGMIILFVASKVPTALDQNIGSSK
jgi:simple sugar transport system permease protein